MDFETGEAVRDVETGEVLVPAINLETGETEINWPVPHHTPPRSRKFRITNLVTPKQETGTVNNEYITSDMTPCLIFLFCATLFLNPIVVACMGAFEICLHLWAHKKNKKLTSANIYYQSPLHIFVREYCGRCKEERAKKKITNLQDKRNYKFIKYGIDYSQGIVM